MPLTSLSSHIFNYVRQVATKEGKIMCDTLVVKKTKSILFGKNSDRSPNEPNLTLFNPHQMEYPPRLKCTYISINEVAQRYATLLVKPSWLWGAEMGINELGVIIGNEAVFTHAQQKEEKLIGMDFVRLALERGGTAKEASQIILELLAKHGQGGNCGFDKPFYYDNSYLISDKHSAFILETSGKNFKLHEVDQIGNISNRLSNTEERFAQKNSEPVFTFFSGSSLRQGCVANSISANRDVSVSGIISILRSHHPRDEKQLFRKGSVKSVCMHKSLLGDHTTGSMIVESRSEGIDTIWMTGCSTPCLSIYKPCFFGIVIPPVFENREESLAYWLQREYLVRAIYAGLIDLETYRAKQKAIQNQFIEEEALLFQNEPSKTSLKEFALKCSQSEQAFVDQYLAQIDLVKNGSCHLPGPWKKKTLSLGKHVFEGDLKRRTAQ